MQKINDFFWFCSGAHVPALLKSPAERNKYVGIGATIFFTGLFASISGAYALYFVFSGSPFAVLAAILFGIIWGLAIFNMDRYIVSTISKRGSGGKQFLQATPRLVLAILIGVVISRPLELKVFDKEIKEQLKSNYLAIQRARIDTLNNTFDRKYKTEQEKLLQLKMERDSLQESLKRDRKDLNYEIFGNKTLETSGIMGYGPYAQRKEEALKIKEQRGVLLDEQIAKQEQLLYERRKFDGLLSEKLMTSADLDSLVALAGFADRNEALGQLKYDDKGKIKESNYWAITFISLLFIFFECLPVFVKLMSAKGPYDDLIAHDEALIIYTSEKDLEAGLAVQDKLHEQKIEIGISRAVEAMKA